MALDISRILKANRETVHKLSPYFPFLDRLTWRQRAYSQEGEDLLLLRYFEWRDSGFYVDVGAHHPFRSSNTQLFYERGWHGLNIDATPGSMAAFRRSRPRDVNLEVGVGRRFENLRFFMFDPPTLNTFDAKAASRYSSGGWAKIKGTVHLHTRPLRDILREHVAPTQIIDFLNVDVEGVDLDVLESNDWTQFRPRVVLVESQGKTLEEPHEDLHRKFLRSVGYVLFGKMFNTFFYICEADAVKYKLSGGIPAFAKKLNGDGSDNQSCDGVAN